MKKSDNIAGILSDIAKEHTIEVATITGLAGGDINQVFKITTPSGKTYAVKLNDPQKYPGMFEAEKIGLDSLRNTGTFTIPEVFAAGIVHNTAYLLLEFIESSSRENGFWRNFGEQLAALHRNSSNSFGFFADNYIGTLPQYNGTNITAADFYITQRLEPQYRMASQNGFDLPNTAPLFKKCSEIIPDEAPSLIHGDLWNGNYLIDAEGFPCLIDPAVAYAPREMDIAMMKLFGGYDSIVFESYNSYFSLAEDWEYRTELWQLYYLLVHLNIFGAGYLNRVTSIISRYS